MAYKGSLAECAMQGLEGGFSEGSLTPVEVDDKLREGHGVLAWDDG